MITGSGIWISVGVAFALLETKEGLISQVVIHSCDAMTEHFTTAPKYSTNQIKEENLCPQAEYIMPKKHILSD
jgi:hypothetical protein